MLQIQNISKTYVTGTLEQHALDNVSFNLRDNEFVAILGPSGSGKTTTLNIIGGLDRYDSGDLVINGVSTKKYTDRDWDSYRNHTIGFVFQSYNLIPHQSVLSNVELALTISGVSRKERKQRALAALEQVGLADQAHKRPNEMSGGQMQRVAIARALVNDPDILLADEPTGALDSETSVQVMELLREVAKDRLVVLVTHNTELAQEYATRIIRLQDGHIVGDTNPYEPDLAALAAPEHKNLGRASMSFGTALSLSFNNLRTKKARTLLTAFAGSIGIIGIALILSLSNGVNQYVEDIQKDTMVSYPITITAETIDLTSLVETGAVTSSEGGGAGGGAEGGEGGGAGGGESHDDDAVYSSAVTLQMASAVSMSLTENNLTAFKEYLDDPDSDIQQYLGEYGIVYSYDVVFSVYTYDTEGVLIDTDGVTIDGSSDSGSSSSSVISSLLGTSSSGASNFEELLAGSDGELVSDSVKENYEVLCGSWPESFDEVVLVLDEHNEISITTLYELGLLPASDYEELMEALSTGEAVTVESVSWSYEEIIGKTFYVVTESDLYVENEDGTFSYIGGDAETIESVLEGAIEVTIVGIVRAAEDAEDASISAVIGYTSALTDAIIEHINESAVVQAQEADPDTNVLTGMAFEPADDETKAADALTYLESLDDSAKAELLRDYLEETYGDSEMVSSMLEMSDAELAAMLDAMIEEGLDDDTLVAIYDAYVSAGSYEENMEAFGAVDLDSPSSISIYADTFEDKESIVECIEAYNESVSEDEQITYTDYVGLLMSSVTTIVDVISYVLIAFVSVSLVVSSIMIGIITYISVLERTKEIGILRAIGASKRNISQVFNAETFIIGLCSGLIGVGVTLLLLIPGNMLIHAVTGTTAVNAALPVASGVLLVVLAMLLTIVAGLLPSSKAAKKDPVIALRTE